MSLDEWFLVGERKIKKINYTYLLADLLFLNYEFSNKEYHDVKGTNIYNAMQEQVKFTEIEKKEIISDAINLIKIKHNLELIDFENMIFEKRKK